ncbi:hypothetical protein E8E11_006994 [Didymella keratinophila]|nr:hypothetical protein E8E11_006994 [Didymella keratinophila]
MRLADHLDFDEEPILREPNPSEHVESAQAEAISAFNEDVDAVPNATKTRVKSSGDKDLRQGTLNIDNLVSEPRETLRASDPGLLVDQKAVKETLKRLPEDQQLHSSIGNQRSDRPYIYGVSQVKSPLFGDQSFGNGPLRHRVKSRRREHRPTQGDWVLIREMDPNRPEIAQAVRQEVLNNASESEPSSDEEADNHQSAPMTRTDTYGTSRVGVWDDPVTDFDQDRRGKRMEKRTKSTEFKLTGQSQFLSSITLEHAFAGPFSEQSEDSDSSVQDNSEEVDDLSRLTIDHAIFEFEEVGSDENDDEGIETVQPSHLEDTRDQHEEAAAPEAIGIMNSLGALHVSEDSHDSEGAAEFMERISRRRRKKPLSLELLSRKRDHHRSVPDDSSYSDNDPQDDDDVEARRLRRKLRGPRHLQGNALKSDNDSGPRNADTLPDDASTLDQSPFLGSTDNVMEKVPDEEEPYELEYARRKRALGEHSVVFDGDDHIAYKVHPSIDLEASERVSPRAALIDEVIEDIEDDRRSVQSLDSSTTLISTFSGLTVLKLESATAELQKIFQEDPDLVGLYRQAIKDAAVGPERLQRNVGRLLRIFARSLRREASQEQEKLACRFVLTKAMYVAQCIVEEFNDKPINQQLRSTEKKQEEEDKPDGRDYNFGREEEDLDEFAPVDEEIFEDLPTLRAFLVNSAAFQVFRQELSKFVLPREPQSISHNRPTRKLIPTAPATKDHHIFRVIRIVKAILLAMGCLEPPLRPGMSRLRWQCRCGATFFEDVTEYRAGGISEIVEEVQSSCVTITAVTYGEAGSQ